MLQSHLFEYLCINLRELAYAYSMIDNTYYRFRWKIIVQSSPYWYERIIEFKLIIGLSKFI